MNPVFTRSTRFAADARTAADSRTGADARTIALRRVTPADAGAMLAFVAGLGVASRRWRFHGVVNGCSESFVRYLTQVDGRRHVAFIACVGDTIVGETRYFIDADGLAAQFAIAVADAFQGHGLAAALMDALAEAARTAGIQRLYGDVVDDNERMAAFLRRQGFTIDVSRWDQCDDGNVVRWVRPLRARAAWRRGTRAPISGWHLPSLLRVFERLAQRVSV